MKYLVVFLFLLPACSSSDRPATIRERQDEALHDPMNWSPNTSSHNDISGGGTADYKKDSMKKDINSVFGP
jgi:hypothetical protein